MKTVLPLRWLIPLVVGALGLMFAGWISLHPPTTGTLQLSFKSGGNPAEYPVEIELNRGGEFQEAVSLQISMLYFDQQTAPVALHVPLVKSIAVRVRGRSKEDTLRPVLTSAAVLDTKGSVLWTAEGTPVSLKPTHPIQLAPYARWLPDPSLGAWMGWGGLVLLAVLTLGPLLRFLSSEQPLPAYCSLIGVSFMAAALLYLAAIWSSRGAPLPSESWVSDIMIQKVADARRYSSPRTLFTGGSSGLYGVDAAFLHAQSGQPVVNLSTHAGLPLSWHLDHCRELWSAGDTVVLQLEFPYWEQENGDLWQIDQELAWGYFASGRWLEPHPYQMVTHVPPDRMLAGLIAKAVPQAYNHRLPVRMSMPWGGYQWYFGVFEMPLNDHGDRLPVYEALDPDPFTYLPLPFNEKTTSSQALDAFIKDAHAVGVRVFFAFPATIQTPEEDFRGPAFKAWTDHLIAWAEPRGATVLGRPEDMQLPNQFFYNTAYHLNEQGRKLHTQKLLEQLRSAGWPQNPAAE